MALFGRRDTSLSTTTDIWLGHALAVRFPRRINGGSRRRGGGRVVVLEVRSHHASSVVVDSFRCGAWRRAGVHGRARARPARGRQGGAAPPDVVFGCFGAFGGDRGYRYRE